MARGRRSGAAVLLVIAAVATRGDAQTPHILHLPIPGDLPAEPVSDTVAQPSSLSSLGVTPAPGNAEDVGPVLRPRSTWQVPSQEMDRQTRSPPGTHLSYREVFTPAIAPFKRLQAYDMVDEMGRMTVRDPSLRNVEVGPAPPQVPYEFIGEVNVEVSPQWPTPLPSVAPDEYLVSYSTSNNKPVSFARDSAGNLFARGTEAGTIKLTFKLAASRTAFVAPPLPHQTMAEVAEMIPQELRPVTPSWLRAASDTVLQSLHVNREAEFASVLNRLVEYFRSFRDEELGQPMGGELYRDLALGRVGACRHRSYAFMLTLHALGIPARYVGNEAHAWSEVFIPGSGWTRIDLGGWDVPLDARSTTDRAMFTPEGIDPFPQPSGYRSQYSQNSRLSTGLPSDEPLADYDPARPRTSGALPNDGMDALSSGGNGSGSSGGMSRNGGNGGNGNGSGNGPGNGNGNGPGNGNGNGPGNGNGSGNGSQSSDPRGSGPANAITLGPTNVASEPAEGEPMRATRLSLDTVSGDESTEATSSQGYVRGTLVKLDGLVRDDQNNPVPGLLIEIQLVSHGGFQKLLGSSVSQGDGHWRARVVLPADLTPGAYTIRASTSGDAHHHAASAE